MKPIILVALLTMASPILADQPYQHPYQNGGYWDGLPSTSPNTTAGASDIERAQAAILAGKDPTEVLGATAAGTKPFTRHPYLNSGYFGDRINGDRE